MHQPLQWIFFDVGNTLLDETDAWHEQLTRLAGELASIGVDVSATDLFATYSQCCAAFAPRQWLEVIRTHVADEASVQTLLKLAGGWRHDLERPFPGARETLAALSKRYRLGIIANQSLGTRGRMETHGFLPFLSLIIGSAEAGVFKPDPRIFELALREAGCAPPAAMMVGDRLDNDVRPARVLGMQTVHVRQGGSGLQVPRDALETPDLIVERIADLPRSLEG